MIRSPLMNVMTRAVEKAARKLKRDYGEVEHLQVSKKGTADFVSNADIAAEKVLREELSHARPDFGFLLEEGGEVAGVDATHRWLVDPLDGTTNFIHAVPYFCISIALEETLPNGKKQIVAGIVYDPLRDEMFMAEKGRGAFLNGRKLRVSARQNLDEALLATGTPRAIRKEYQPALAMMNAATSASVGLRCNGAAALDLAYVAAGRFDGFWCLNLKPWDIGAGMLLITEAGGEVSEIGGGSNLLAGGSILATNGLLHKKVDALFGEIAYNRLEA